MQETQQQKQPEGEDLDIVQTSDRIVAEASPALTTYTKKWVRLFLYMSFLDFLVAGTLALMMRTDQSGGPSFLGPFGSPGAFGQLLTAHGLGMFVGWQFPFTYGLCLYVYPKYMGRKLYAERLLPWIFATFFIGFYLVWLSTIFGFGPGWYFLFPLPIVGGPGDSAPWQLAEALVFFIGMMIVNISLVLFTIVSFGSAFSKKYDDEFNNSEGMNTSLTARFAASIGFDAWMPQSVRSRIVSYPIAAIGAVVTTISMIVSLPPFMALLANGALASLSYPPFLSNLIAKNFLWINYHPIVYFAFFPLIGMYYTLLPIFSKRVFGSSRWVRVPWVLLLIPSVGVYSHHIFMDTAQPFALQLTSQYMTMAISVGSAISIFTLLALVWRSKFEWNLTAKWIIGAIAGWFLGGIIGAELGDISFNVYGHNTYMVIAHFHFNALDGIVLAAFGFLYWVIPEISNRKWYSQLLGEIHLWGTFVGGFGMVGTFAIMGYLGVPRREFSPVVPVLPFTMGYTFWLDLAFVFAIIIGAAQIPFAWNIVRTLLSPPIAPHSETPLPTPEVVGPKFSPPISRGGGATQVGSDSAPSPSTPGAETIKSGGPP